MQLPNVTLRARRFTPSVCAMAVAVLLLALAIPLFLYRPATAELLGYRRLQLSDSTVSVPNVSYNFSFNTMTTGPIGSIEFQICTNYQYEPTDPCTTPPGLDLTATTLSAQSGVTDFSMEPNLLTDNKIVITRPVASVVTPQPLSYVLSGITNPSVLSSYYVRIATHSASDGTGPDIDYGIVVFALNHGIEITTEVPPYLLFCTGITIEGFNCGTAEGNFISFGELSSRTARTGTSQMLASTNAPFGYSVTMTGTTMTAGNNIIPAMPGDISRPGTSQFGVNGRANTVPGVGSEPEGGGLTNPSAGYNNPNFFRFRDGDIVASSAGTDDYRKITMSYLVNTAAGQSPGRYVTTISYICLANF